jgi:hypothetical protein
MAAVRLRPARDVRLACDVRDVGSIWSPANDGKAGLGSSAAAPVRGWPLPIVAKGFSSSRWSPER